MVTLSGSRESQLTGEAFSLYGASTLGTQKSTQQQKKKENNEVIHTSMRETMCKRQCAGAYSQPILEVNYMRTHAQQLSHHETRPHIAVL